VVADVGDDLGLGDRPTVDARLWAAIQFPGDADGVAAEIEDCSNQNVGPFYLIENRVGEAFGEEAMEASEMGRMDASIEEEGFDVGTQDVHKIGAQTWFD